MIGSCGDELEKNSQLPFTIPQKIKFIGHKGSGPINKHGNPGWHENGLPSVLNALKKTDGTEVDIQMSADSTLWLYHDHTIQNCDGTLKNFSTLKDSTIERINTCNFNNQLITIQAFNNALIKNRLYNKYISLDLKVLSNPSLLKKWKVDSLLSFVFDAIHQKLNVAHLALEIPENISYSKATRITDTDVYKVLYDLSSLKSELETNYSVPFYELNKNKIKGEKIQLWTPNNASDMILTAGFKPDFIQSDNIELCSFMIRLRDKSPIKQSNYSQLKAHNLTNEFIEVVSDTAVPEKSILFHLDISESQLKEEQLLVLSVKDKGGKNIHWEAVNLIDREPYFFLNQNIKKDNGKTYTIYVWNKLKTPVNIIGSLYSYSISN
jgi:hypothetical protein